MENNTQKAPMPGKDTGAMVIMAVGDTKVIITTQGVTIPHGPKEDKHN